MYIALWPYTLIDLAYLAPTNRRTRLGRFRSWYRSGIYTHYGVSEPSSRVGVGNSCVCDFYQLSPHLWTVLTILFVTRDDFMIHPVLQTVARNLFYIAGTAPNNDPSVHRFVVFGPAGANAARILDRAFSRKIANTLPSLRYEI